VADVKLGRIKKQKYEIAACSKPPTHLNEVVGTLQTTHEHLTGSLSTIASCMPRQDLASGERIRACILPQHSHTLGKVVACLWQPLMEHWRVKGAPRCAASLLTEHRAYQPE